MRSSNFRFNRINIHPRTVGEDYKRLTDQLCCIRLVVIWRLRSNKIVCINIVKKHETALKNCKQLFFFYLK